jgi:hypothetical protein
MNRSLCIVSSGVLFVATSIAHGQIRITEWMYSGANGEFIEFTNMSGLPVDMSDKWFYTDSDRGVMDVSLSGFGIVQPGESVIITESAEAAFRTAWALDPAVKVIGSNLNSNLGRVDEINVYHSGALVDRLTFGDNRVPMDPPVGAPPTAGSIRTQNRSGNPVSLAALGVNDVFQWVLANTAAQGPDGFGTYTSVTGGDRANPGIFNLTLSGDYNEDGSVDAADYVRWRDEIATAEAYTVWRANFGRSLNAPVTQVNNVPEPAILPLAVVCVASLLVRRSMRSLPDRR